MIGLSSMNYPMKYFWNENFNRMDVSTRLIIEKHLDRFGIYHIDANLQAVMEFLSEIEENDFNGETGHKIDMVAGELECELCGETTSSGGTLSEKCPKNATI